MTLIYKILGQADWDAALAAGAFAGAGVDLADGYIHLSAADQAQTTARLYFSNRTDLVLVTVDAEAVGPSLKWEASRGGALFPHIYGALPLAAVVDSRPLALDAAGEPVLGALQP